MGYIRGTPRDQSLLYPEVLDVINSGKDARKGGGKSGVDEEVKTDR